MRGNKVAASALVAVLVSSLVGCHNRAAEPPHQVAALAEAKRPLIRLRGRWVMLDPALLDRLRRPPRTRMRAAEALGAVLAGSAEIDGQTVTVIAEAGHAAQLDAPGEFLALLETFLGGL